MRRYAFFGPYRQPYTCFKCRKSFHATMEWGRAKRRDVEFSCPECRQPMHSMGLDFNASRRHDVRQWCKVELLYANDFTYHNCGYGAGRRPKWLSEVSVFLRQAAQQREQIVEENRQKAERQVQEARHHEREKRKPKKVRWEFYPAA